MCEKAIAIGTYFAASGAHVIFGVGSPVGASEVTTDLLTRGWEEMMGGEMEFIPDWNEMLARSLELIDAKRAALKLPAYDPSQYGDSGDSLYFQAIRGQLGGYGGNGHGHAHAHDFAGVSDSTDHADTTEA
jgi:hypothetical protein